MNDIHLIFYAGLFGLIYLLGLLGAMAAMAHRASSSTAKAISHIPAQTNLLNVIEQSAIEYAYRPVKDALSNQGLVLRKGKGWLTSLTELHIHLQDDGSAKIEVLEGVNFLFTKIYFPITAPTFLGLPIRKRKLKRINVLLKELNAQPIAFGKADSAKKIRFKK